MGVWSPLTTNWSVTSDSDPRTAEVDSIGHHHAASPNLMATLSLFQPGGRTVSPNYCIYRDQIWGVVPEDRRAWTSASEWADNRSITYEIINASGAPHWSFDPATLRTVMRLDADIMRRYPKVRAVHGIPGFWEHRNLYEWYGRSYATACAGPSFRIGEVIAGTLTYLTPEPALPEEENDMPLIVAERADSALAKGLYDPQKGRIVRHISKAENNLLRAAQRSGGIGHIVYGQVSDADFVALGG